MSSPVRRQRPSSGTRPRGPLVLVVEHDDDVREAYSVELAAAGFMVLEAPDGSTAVEKALQFGPHAVVLDLMLPGIDGLKVARRLRADDRTHDIALIAIISTTGTASEAAGSLAIAAGCDSFVSRPVAPGMLTGEVLRLVARRSRNARGRAIK